MEMRVDKSRNDGLSRDVNFALALVLAMGANDFIAADGDVGFYEITCYEVEELAMLEYKIGGLAPRALVDAVF